MNVSTKVDLGATKRPDARLERAMPSVPVSQRNEWSEPTVQGDDGATLGIPRRGHVLSTVVETYGKPIRDAVSVLSESLCRTDSSELRRALLWPRQEKISVRSDAEMVAWSMVSMWVVGIAAGTLKNTACLEESEQWFFGPSDPVRLTRLASPYSLTKAEKALRSKANALAYFQLLPYILDPHGPGSRLSVRRDPATRSARERKRSDGVFYTPPDVAEYMASACLATTNGRLPTVLDPACGTGVFLRAALQHLRQKHPDREPLTLAYECLFGVDIDPWPLDATAFVLLCDSVSGTPGTRVPAEYWRRLRLNLACVDALCIDSAEGTFGQPDSGGLGAQGMNGRVSLSRLFPALDSGATVILGNPPYAQLNVRPDERELALVYETIAVKQQPSAEIYLAFIEQMIRLTNNDTCSGALVLPLSVACNIGPQFSAIRELISRTRGQWRFAFFDREPHALFGEDVKTRNAIMLWTRTLSDQGTTLSTGPLRKWRGDSRAEMFRSIRFTLIDGAIRGGIPKIDGDCQATALKILSCRLGQLEQVALSIDRINLAETPAADDRTVFVGATAYNFLNVFLRPRKDLLSDGQVLSEHPLHAIQCASKSDALAVFAILSSHLAYWWWHAHGDGFHVTKHFIAEFPFGLEDVTDKVAEALSSYGAELWSLIKSRPIVSVNRGRTSLAFTPNGHDGIRRRIDHKLAEVLGLPNTFVDKLQQFTARTVAATVRNYAITENERKGRRNEREDSRAGSQQEEQRRRQDES